MLLARKSPEGKDSTVTCPLRPASAPACELRGPLLRAPFKPLLPEDDGTLWALGGRVTLNTGPFMPVLVPLVSSFLPSQLRRQARLRG